MEFLQHPVARGAIAGVVTAAWVDFAAFRKWQSFKEARDYKWSLAVWRWVQGAIVGAVAGAGLTAAV